MAAPEGRPSGTTPLLHGPAASDGAKAFAVRYFRGPRLRKDWHNLATEGDPLVGQVTVEESLWVVVFTMGIAASRDQIFADQDVEWWVIHFFCFWGVTSASIQYSTRFNDTDFWHKAFWALFMLGMAGMVAYLNHELRGFAACTGSLYLLIAIAHSRVAFHMPRARVFCLCFAASHLIAAGLFGVLALLDTDARGHNLDARLERRLLWAHVFVEPCVTILFVALTQKPHQKRQWDIPLSLEYMVKRFEGMHMMIIVCSFLFPLGLCGVQFASAGSSALAVVLGNFYAQFLKLSVVDRSEQQLHPEALECHAIRRSRLTAVSFLLTFPLGMIGIALTGVGFVAAAQHRNEAFTRSLLCWGPAITWLTFLFSNALHAGFSLAVQRSEAASTGICILLFLLPLLLEPPVLVVAALDVLVMGLLLASQIAIPWRFTGRIPNNWSLKSPRLIIDWDQVRAGVVAEPYVTSEEHFLTVLLAVVVFALNAALRQTRLLRAYILRWWIFYGVMKAGIRYAARFNDIDAYHKVLWLLYQLLLLLMLEGLTGPANGGHWRLFSMATGAMCLFLAAGFSGRTALLVPRVRRFTGFFVVINAACAALALKASLFGVAPGSAPSSMWLLGGILQLAEIVFYAWSAARGESRKGAAEDWVLPVNASYLVKRNNGLLMDVVGVAVLVPNAVYPGLYSHRGCVFASCVLAVLLAVCFKMGYFDCEPVSIAHHAVNRSLTAALAFQALSEAALLSVSLVGAGVPMLIASVGVGGSGSRDVFAQGLLCGAVCGFWTSLSAMKLLHRPRQASSRRIHLAKAACQAFGAAAIVLPLVASPAADLEAFGLVVTVSSAIVASEQFLNALTTAQGP